MEDLSNRQCCTKKRCGRDSITSSNKTEARSAYSDQVRYGRGFAYLRRFIKSTTIANAHGKRKMTFLYFIPQGDDRIEVCQLAFKDIFGVTEAAIRSARNEPDVPVKRNTSVPPSSTCSTEIQIKTEPVDDEESDVVFIKSVQPTRCTCTIRHSIEFAAQESKTLQQFRDATDWSKYLLKDSTLEKLFEEDFASVSALKTINEQDHTYFNKECTIKRGQINLIREFVKCLNCEQHLPIITEEGKEAKKRCTEQDQESLDSNPSLKNKSVIQPVSPMQNSSNVLGVIQPVSPMQISSNVQGTFSNKEPSRESFREETPQASTTQETTRRELRNTPFTQVKPGEERTQSEATVLLPGEGRTHASTQDWTIRQRGINSFSNQEHPHDMNESRTKTPLTPVPPREASTESTPFVLSSQEGELYHDPLTQMQTIKDGTYTHFSQVSPKDDTANHSIFYSSLTGQRTYTPLAPSTTVSSHMSLKSVGAHSPFNNQPPRTEGRAYVHSIQTPSKVDELFTAFRQVSPIEDTANRSITNASLVGQKAYTSLPPHNSVSFLMPPKRDEMYSPQLSHTEERAYSHSIQAPSMGKGTFTQMIESVGTPSTQVQTTDHKTYTTSPRLLPIQAKTYAATIDDLAVNWIYSPPMSIKQTETNLSNRISPTEETRIAGHSDRQDTVSDVDPPIPSVLNDPKHSAESETSATNSPISSVINTSNSSVASPFTSSVINLYTSNATKSSTSSATSPSICIVTNASTTSISPFSTSVINLSTSVTSPFTSSVTNSSTSTSSVSYPFFSSVPNPSINSVTYPPTSSMTYHTFSSSVTNLSTSTSSVTSLVTSSVTSPSSVLSRLHDQQSKTLRNELNTEENNAVDVDSVVQNTDRNSDEAGDSTAVLDNRGVCAQPTIFATRNVVGMKWKRCKQFKTSRQLKNPQSVATHPNTRSIFVSTTNAQIAILSRDGVFEKFIKNIKSIEVFYRVIYIPYNDSFICFYIEPYPSKRFHIVVYDSNWNLTKHNIINEESSLSAFAVDSKGQIIAGNHPKITVSIYQQDGELVSQFHRTDQPLWLASTPDDDVVISFVDDTLQVMDQSGNNARLITPPPVVKKWRPGYVFCSKRGELFVENNESALYRYVCMNGNYEYHDCIIKLKPDRYVLDIALSADEDEMYVVIENVSKDSSHIEKYTRSQDSSS